MGSLDQESLFSLELVADSLSLAKTIPCRFPAIAFRLLDFPTLIIYHIEPDLGEDIKRKIKLKSNLKVPEQLVELKDKNGVYQVKKGKSCLFKVPPNVLLSHLQNTPLYVIVIDTYPGTPKLVGNCNVPLAMTMNEVYNDIKKVGLSVPTSRGEKGMYQIFNLMGVEIGQVTFGFRLLSLGIGLMSHIPDRSVVKMQKSGIVKKSALVTQESLKSMEREATEIILQDLETVDQNIQAVLSTPGPSQNMNETQTDMILQNVATTQTTEVRKKLVEKERKKMNRIDTLTTLAQVTPACDDIIITNIVCPPALYYNSEADPPQIAPGLTLSDYLVHKQRDAMQVDSDTESVDSDGTIRHEDRFSDTELDSKPTVKTVSEYPPPPKKQLKKTPSKLVVSLGAMAEFPLLSALMSEIVALHGTAEGVAGAATGVKLKAHTTQGVQMPSYAELPRTESSTSRKPLRPVSPTRTYMLRKALSTALQTKPLEQVPSQHASELTSSEQDGHMPHSSRRRSNYSKPSGQVHVDTWFHGKKPQKRITRVPAVSSIIMPGMTKSQRLRLSITNPNLLEDMEKTEKERVEKFISRRKASGAGFYSSIMDVNTEMGKHPAGSYDPYTQKVPKLQLHANCKKPVPTPRMSIFDDNILVREVPAVVPRKSKRAYKKEVEEERHQIDAGAAAAAVADDDREQNSHSTNPASSYVLDVHVPSGQMDNTISEHDSHVDRQEGDQHLRNKKKQASKVKSPRPEVYSDKFEDVKESEHKPYDPFGKTYSSKAMTAQSSEPVTLQYSDEFDDDDDIKVSALGIEAVDPGEELGLKRMVDRYSDDEDEEDEDEEDEDKRQAVDAGEALGLQRMVSNYTNNNIATGIDPAETLGLRQIVDKYSDDDVSSNDSPSFHSAKSNDSSGDAKPKPKLKVATSLVRTVAPPASDMSPSIATRQPRMATRNPVTESLSTEDETNPETTAYIHRSEMTNSQFSSIESTGRAALEFRSARKSGRKPMISPRKSLERVRTESVSSYAPSEHDIAPLSLAAEYSEDFDTAESNDDHDKLNIKYMKDAQVAPEARFGYTWSGQT